MADQLPPLGPEDYRYLFGMVSSTDKSVQQQGLSVVKGMKPEELQGFADWQKQQFASSHGGVTNGEVTRRDNEIGGLPPELAAVGGLGLARSVAGSTGNMAMKLVKGIGAQATPIIKYQVVKTGLESMGAPPAVASVIAYGVSGSGKGKTPTVAAKAVPTAEEAMGLTSDEAMAARNATANMPPSVEPAPAPVSQSAAAPVPTVAPAAAPMAIKSAAELAEFQRLIKSGTPWQKAVQLISAQRDLIQRMGLPTPNTAADAVAQRNVTGAWK